MTFTYFMLYVAPWIAGVLSVYPVMKFMKWYDDACLRALSKETRERRRQELHKKLDWYNRL